MEIPILSSYWKLLEKVEKLNQEEQLRLLEQITVLIRSKATGKTRRSILEIQGMGKICGRILTPGNT